MLAYYLGDPTTLIQSKGVGVGRSVLFISYIWVPQFHAATGVEATLHCTMFIQEPAVLLCSALCWGFSVYPTTSLAFPILAPLVRFLRRMAHRPSCRIR
jgi:hypothetical protein